MEEKDITEVPQDIFSVITQLQNQKRIQSQIYISPASLAERNFYWEALDLDSNPLFISVEEAGETKQLPIVIGVPIPKFWFSGVYNKLILLALELSVEILTREVKDRKALDGVYTGYASVLVFLEYLYYLLHHQDEYKDLILESETKDELEVLLKNISVDMVDRWVKEDLHIKGMEYTDSIYSLIPLFMDLYLYLNGVKSFLPATAGVVEKAEAIRRHL